MRIRKNNKHSSLLLLSSDVSSSSNDLGPTHFVCQLNQSPWDVIPFSSSSSSSPYPHQFGWDDNGFVAAALNGCGFVGSVEPIESEHSDEKPIVGSDEEAHEITGTNGGLQSWPVAKTECAKTDGKFWKCKREAREGHHFCEHHISQLKSYGEKPAKANGAGPGRARAARNKKSEASSGSRSSQYYYYSGFGPLWGKKQGGNRGAFGPSQSASDGISYINPGDELEGEGDDRVEDDEEEGTRGVEGSKKRVRKPVKARSLKSLIF
ncbi:hypothetical protein MLD38_020776 [Melastoma candidum]|uniref:Uncharacterized protein n=1 Tax=Melastoma candidum TaxID=119954 RepID=A0ACB9QE26_9MYRT|nr:hypothetical protein MLD38_020776 [Melastoma candidum]